MLTHSLTHSLTISFLPHVPNQKQSWASPIVFLFFLHSFPSFFIPSFWFCVRSSRFRVFQQLTALANEVIWMPQYLFNGCIIHTHIHIHIYILCTAFFHSFPSVRLLSLYLWSQTEPTYFFCYIALSFCCIPFCLCSISSYCLGYFSFTRVDTLQLSCVIR